MLLLPFAAAVRDFDEGVEYLSSLSCAALPFALMVVGSCCFVTCGSGWGKQRGSSVYAGGSGKGRGLMIFFLCDCETSNFLSCHAIASVQYEEFLLDFKITKKLCGTRHELIR